MIQLKQETLILSNFEQNSNENFATFSLKHLICSKLLPGMPMVVNRERSHLSVNTFSIDFFVRIHIIRDFQYMSFMADLILEGDMANIILEGDADCINAVLCRKSKWQVDCEVALLHANQCRSSADPMQI